MENFALRQVDAAEAAGLMRAAGLVDPAGIATPESIAEAGVSFKLTTAGGEGVFVTSKRGQSMWIHGAGAVGSQGLTGKGLAVIEAMAAQVDCSRVSFQTARRGLVRQAAKSGFRVTGFILEKIIK